MALRLCNCCQKWWDVQLKKKPGFYRIRCRDGFIHDFERGVPPRFSWPTETRYCIVCNTPHIFFIGPVTGKYHSNVCNT
jgi:hypothetical protein